MSRTRSSAKAAGTRMETLVAWHLSEALDDDRIERRAKNGAKDRGDIANVRTALGERVVIECKDVARTDLAGWVREAETERGNDDAAVAVVVHKRRGKGEKQMGEQYVTMTLDDLVVLLGGKRMGES